MHVACMHTDCKREKKHAAVSLDMEEKSPWAKANLTKRDCGRSTDRANQVATKRSQLDRPRPTCAERELLRVPRALRAIRTDRWSDRLPARGFGLLLSYAHVRKTVFLKILVAGKENFQESLAVFRRCFSFSFMGKERILCSRDAVPVLYPLIRPSPGCCSCNNYFQKTF
jgi:hypothetical protein